MFVSGDVVTLSASPKIWLDRFKSLSPHASLTRTLGEEPQADLAAMRVDLDVLVYESLKVEIEALNDCCDVLQGMIDTSELLEFCKRKIGHVQATEVVKKSKVLARR